MNKKLLTYLGFAIAILMVGGISVAVANQEGGYWFKHKSGFKTEMTKEQILEKKAAHLGITTEELQAELDSGKTLKQVFEESGITKEGSFDKMRQHKMEYFQKMIDEGIITGEQADAMHEKMKELKGDYEGKRMHWEFNKEGVE